MQSKKSVLLVLALLALSILLVSATALAQDDTLTALPVDMISMSPFDSVWNGVPALTVTLEQQAEGGTPNMTADIQAVHTGDTIYIRTVWRDDTLNNVRRLWHFDGDVWTRGDKVDGVFNNEDRLGFTFDINGGREYAFLGCGSACHSGDDVDYMGYAEDGYEGQLIDIWHWKATRSAAAGYADDQTAGMVSYEDPDEVTGRSSDSKDSGSYANNKNEAGDGPAFMYPEGVTSGPLFKATAVEVGDTVFEAGATIPYYLIERPVGSRGDISASSFYVQDMEGGGYWYVVMSRAFDTGNEDDAVLTLGAEHVFGVAIFDNGGGKKHATYGDPLKLVISE